MIRKITACILLAAAGMSASPGLASDTGGPATLYGVYGTWNGALLFSTNANRTSIPACGAGNAQRWAIDASTTAGQAAVAVLLTAWTQHKRVWVTGTGTCTIWGDTETVEHFLVED